MPTSNLHVAPAVVNLVETTARHDTVLDIGPGWGKYATLLREYLNVKPATIDAVEAWPDYVADHALAALYDHVFIGDATWSRWRTWLDAVEVDALAQLNAYDVVLMVDVIEHMEKSAAMSVLDAIGGTVVICTPVEFFHNGDGLPPTEAHVSHWTGGDFAIAAGRRRLEVVENPYGALLYRIGPKPDHRSARAKVHRAYT